MTRDERKAVLLNAIKSLFHEFDVGSWDSIEMAIEHDNYVDKFPEDMNEDRTDWNTLYSMFGDMIRAFNILEYLIVREVERKDQEKGKKEE